jgi:zinc transport system ATP-binding protein
MSSLNKAVCATDLSFSFGPLPLIEKANFSINQGEFIGIIGPNGSGKTTLLKILMGFLSPSSGKIKLLGLSPKEGRKNLAYVPQHLNFDRKFPITLLQMVLTGLLSKSSLLGGFSKREKQQAFEALKSVGLEKLSNQCLGTLSGGQLQRGLIARALLSNPKILLLDEPTASIDKETTAQIYELLNSLKGKMTIIMVTHHIDRMVGSLNHILCLNQQVEFLAPEEVCHHHALGLYHQPSSQTKSES